jgi:hypothetical protein
MRSLRSILLTQYELFNGEKMLRKLCMTAF